MVMDQGNFHFMDLKFTIIWKSAYLPKSNEPQLNQTVDFISSHSFLTHTNPKSWQNFHSNAVLNVYTASLQTAQMSDSICENFLYAPCTSY